MPLISQSIPVAIGSNRPKKGEREMGIGKERWERNPEGEGNHITQIFYISVNSCEGKREINVGKETSESV